MFAENGFCWPRVGGGGEGGTQETVKEALFTLHDEREGRGQDLMKDAVFN